MRVSVLEPGRRDCPKGLYRAGCTAFRWRFSERRLWSSESLRSINSAQRIYAPGCLLNSHRRRCSTWPLNVPLNAAAAIDHRCLVAFLTTFNVH